MGLQHCSTNSFCTNMLLRVDTKSSKSCFKRLWAADVVVKEVLQYWSLYVFLSYI